jgi:Peptidase C13 family
MSHSITGGSPAEHPSPWGRPWSCTLALLLSASACRPPAGSASASPSSADPFADQPYASDPLPREAKVFLVAGGDDVGNFAAEVVEQRALWKRAGLRDEEIACYFAKPTHRALAEDGEQLEQLAPALRGCYPADPATLHAHLRQAARAAPPFLYLFVTSHGLPPLLRWKAGVDDVKALPDHLELQKGEVGHFDRHAIGLEAGEGPGLGEVAELLWAHRAGAPVQSLVFTPDTLAAALAELPAASDKIVVLQACFSGGFIGRPDDDGPSPLTRLPRITVLTATSPAQPSFGCSPGAQRTYWGGAFNRVLADVLERAPGPPPTLPWAELHERVRFVVETMEVIDGAEPSQPSFFSNVPPATAAGH